MNEQLDTSQMEAITVNRNAVVTAGAGSGKTTVLAERFYWLLATKRARVDEILTLTFTNKAASEMYEKIYNRLRLTDDPYVREQLKDFDKAQVSTLDSFCSQIVRNSSEMFGIPSDYTYDEDRLLRMAREFSLDFILDRLNSKALKELIMLHGFEKTWLNFFTDLAFRHFHLASEFDFGEAYNRQIEKCRLDIAHHGEDWMKAAGKLLSMDPRVKSIQMNQDLLKNLGDIRPPIHNERYGELLLLLGNIKLKKPGGKAALDILRMKELVEEIKSETEILIILAQTLYRRSTLKGIFDLLEKFQILFKARKRSAGLITFQDIVEMSIQVLIRNKPVRQFYKKKFRYIMIDEFQDNNQQQKDLLYLLAEKISICGQGVPEAHNLEEDKLFFVGDEKQSIYRFRGADVSVFKSLSHELKDKEGKVIELNTNYRSEPGLIHFYNRIFKRVMERASSDYEARFQELIPEKAQNAVKPEILFCYKPVSESESESGEVRSFTNEESEAFAIARYLSDAVQNKRLIISDRGGKRPAEFEDFTLLMRSTSNQSAYERMFRHFNIPYSTQNVRSLFVEALINDFYLLFQLAVYPEDRSAYAGLLRSPFVNISDETFIRLLLADRPGNDPSMPFNGISRKEFTEEDRKKLTRGGEIYRYIRENMDSRPISELIYYLWYKTGYRYYVLQHAQYHSYLEHYDYLMKLADRADKNGDSLALFLDFLRENLGTYEKLEDLEILKPEVAGVQLMTIHKSKGLEFPIVILVDAGNRGRTSEPGALYYISDLYGLTITLSNKNYFSILEEEESEKKEIAELKRLLYVVLTRAKSHLIISGVHNRANRSSSKTHLNMLLHGLDLEPDSLIAQNHDKSYTFKVKIIEDLTREEFVRCQSKKIQLKTRKSYYEEAEELGRRYPRRNYAVTEISSLMDLERKDEIRLPALPIDRILKEKRLENSFGSLTHSLLSRKLLTHPEETGPPDWLKFDIPPEYREESLSAAYALCQNFFTSELGMKALNADFLETEFPFLFNWDGGEYPLYIGGQIDLFFETHDKAYIIDFKTDRVYREGEYSAQLGLYSLAAGEMTEKKLYCYLFLLRNGRAISLDSGIDWGEKLKNFVPEKQ